MHAAARYESAYLLFAAGAASHDTVQEGPLSDVWKYSPLEETCALFARKFMPDTSLELDAFFNDCDQIGLGLDCLMRAAHRTGAVVDGAPPSWGVSGEFLQSEEDVSDVEGD